MLQKVHHFAVSVGSFLPISFAIAKVVSLPPRVVFQSGVPKADASSIGWSNTKRCETNRPLLMVQKSGKLTCWVSLVYPIQLFCKGFVHPRWFLPDASFRGSCLLTLSHVIQCFLMDQSLPKFDRISPPETGPNFQGILGIAEKPTKCFRTWNSNRGPSKFGIR